MSDLNEKGGSVAAKLDELIAEQKRTNELPEALLKHAEGSGALSRAITRRFDHL